MATKNEAIQQLLNSHILFCSLSPEQKAVLEPLFEVKKVDAGEVVAQYGAAMDGMFSVYAGQVRQKEISETGKRVSTGTLGVGMSFGEICLFKDDTWTQQFVAESKCILLYLSVEQVHKVFRGAPELKRQLAQQVGLIELGNRLRRLLGADAASPELEQNIVPQLGIKVCKRGNVLFRQGADDPRLYYIVSGSFELQRETLGCTVVLEHVSRDALLGEGAALTLKPHTYSAQAVTDATVMVIPQAAVQMILGANYPLKVQLEKRIDQLKNVEEQEVSSLQRAEGVDQRLTLDRVTEEEYSQGALKEIQSIEVVRQHEEMECPAACLTMVMKHYKKDLTLGQVQELTNLYSPEATIYQVCGAAENLGFRAKVNLCEYSDLPKLELPRIIHWENYHYMVLFQVSSVSVRLADPAQGIVTISRKDFELGWSGAVIAVEPTARFAQLEPPKNPYMHFIGYLTPYSKYFGEAFLAALTINVLGLTTPLFIQNIVDKVVVHYDKSLLNMMLLGMALVTVFKLITTATQQLLLAHTIARVDMKLVSEFYRHILSLPMSFFVSRRIGDITTRFGENQKIRQLIAGSTITVILNTMMISVYLVMMWMYSTPLTLLVLIFIPFYIANTLFFTPRLKEISNSIFLTSASQQSRLIESLHGIETVKATANEYLARSRWEDAFTDNINLGYKRSILSLISGAIAQLLSLGSSITVLWYGGHLVIDEQMSIGELMGFNMLMGAVMAPVMQMVQLWDSFQEIRISVERVSDINNVQPEMPPALTPENLPVVLPRIDGKIEFRNVQFRYGGSENPLVLNDLNLVIEPGQTVAFVGPSGCGKSTLIRMVLGFNMPVGGQCLIDSKDIVALDFPTYRKQIGVVLQDSFLFSDTVVGNIALGDPQPDMQAVIEAARLSSSHDFIERLTLGYHTLVGEKGVQLSGGQRQRLCIARALYRNPRILIFDEATSSLDNESEAQIQKNMHSILRGRTSLVVAHRLSTIMDADYICFLDNGRVLEKGSHDELIAEKGRYYEMAKKQFGL